MKWLTGILILLVPACSLQSEPAPLPATTETIATLENKVKNKSYKVRGKRYYPISVQKALNYTETGEASFYGRGKRRTKTSSGEYINPKTSLTAAHRTLPIPCKVKVTCLNTGKSVVVRINDRGPFVRRRVIDLTVAAAKKLGMTGKGITQVRLEVISVGDPPYEVEAP